MPDATAPTGPVAGTPAAKPVKGPLTREAAIEKLDAAGMFDSHTMNDIYDNLRTHGALRCDNP